MGAHMEELKINYKGQQIAVSPHANGVNTFFNVHLPAEDVRLKIKYIDENPVWVENDGDATDRAEEIGRLIEEYDRR
jgi:hypothetical protein